MSENKGSESVTVNPQARSRMDAIMLRVPLLRKRKRSFLAINERNGDVSPTTRLPELDTIQHMVWKDKIPHVALLLLFCVNTVCSGQTITIRLVDLTSHSPVSNQHIYIFGISGKADMKEGNVRLELSNPLAADMTLVTDAKGEATFNLPKSVPSYFYVHAALSSRHWDCFCAPRVATEELEQKGIVVKNAEGKAEPSIQAKPREILFALRPTSWWVRLFWPVLKG